MSMENHAFPEEFHVDWQLLRACNHLCDYDKDCDAESREHLSREALAAPIFRILSLRYPRYVFNIRGGEPTIHPYFAHIVRYLLTCGRDVRVNARTNGLAPIKHYEALLKNLPADRLHLYLNVHLKYVDARRLQDLIRVVRSNGQRISVNLNVVPEFAQQAAHLAALLNADPDPIPFGASFPKGRFDIDIAGAPPAEGLPWAEGAAPAMAQGICVGGVTGAKIAPDGAITLGLAENDCPYSFGAMLENPVFLPGIPPGPVFANMEDAYRWLGKLMLIQVIRDLQSGPLREPWPLAHRESGAMRRIRQRLRQLRPASAPQRSIFANPLLWFMKRDQIEEIYSTLADDQSRLEFLYFLKASLLGHSGYIDAAAGRPGRDLGASGAAPLRIQAGEQIEAPLARQIWQGESFSTILPMSCDWLDGLLRLIRFEPEYDVSICVAGDELLATAAPYESAPEPPAALGPLDPALATFVVYGLKQWPETEAALSAILGAFEERAQILLILEPDAEPVIRASAERLGAACGARVSIQALPDNAPPCAIWDAAISQARGAIVAFVNDPDFDLEAAHAAMLADPQLDCVITCGIGSPRELDGPGAVAALASSRLPLPGFAGSVFRADFLRGRGWIAAAFKDSLPENLIVLGALYGAKAARLQKERIVSLRPQTAEPSPLASLGGCLKWCALARIAHGLPDSISAELVARFLGSIWRIPDISALLPQWLNPDNLGLLAQYPALILSYADALARLVVGNVEADAGSEPRCAVVPSLSAPFNVAFSASIIVYVDAQVDLRWREAALKMDFGFVEWLVIDNASDEETRAALEDMTSLCPNVRLFRMGARATKADCYNIGLSQASGRVILFMEGSSRLAPDFQELAETSLRSLNFSAFIFAMMHEDDKKDEFRDDALPGGNALKRLIDGRLDLVAGRVLFRREALVEQGLAFDPAAPEPDIDFLVRALPALAPRFRLERKLLGVQGRLGRKLWIGPGSLDAALMVFKELDKIAYDRNVAGFARFYLEEVWLPTRAALDGPAPAEQLGRLFVRAALESYADWKRDAESLREGADEY